MRRASATSFSSRLTMFFFHMPRNSIQPMPNSRAAISQTCPKSCEISSLITATRKVDPESTSLPMLEAAFAAVMAAIPTRNSRRAMGVGITAPERMFIVADEARQQIYHQQRSAESAVVAPASRRLSWRRPRRHPGEPPFGMKFERNFDSGNLKPDNFRAQNKTPQTQFESWDVC